MSSINVNTIKSRLGGPPTLPSGVVVSAAATFSSDVSIGGTLTYEDVTNVDVVGLITARSGIELGAAGVGGTIRANGDTTLAGVVTATSFSGAATGLTGVPGGQITGALAAVDGSALTGMANTANVNTAGLNVIGIATVGTALTLGDNVHARFGNSGDLKIYHDSGGQSRIEESGSSVLKIMGSDLRLSNTGNTADYIQANDGAEVNLYFNGSKKFETHNTGIRVTGIATVTGDVNVGSAVTVYASAGIVSATSFSGDGSGLTGVGGLSMVDEWGQFQGDGNSSSGPWNDHTFGAGGNRGQLTRSAYGNMPVGTGMTHSSGVFTFPSTGVYEISAKWLIQRYSWNGTLKIRMELSTDSGSSYVTGYDQGGIDTAMADVHSSYSDIKNVITNSGIVNVADASTYRLKFMLNSSDNEFYIFPSSRIIFKKLN